MRRKRILAGILCILLLLGTAPAASLAGIADWLSVTAAAETYYGTCGVDADNVMWSLDIATGILTVNGTGKIRDYENGAYAPWYAYRSFISTITLGNGITSIGNWAFANLTNLKSVTIPDSVIRIGSKAFYYTPFDNKNLSKPDEFIYIGHHLISANPSISGEKDILPGTISIADEAFMYCAQLTGITIPDSVKSIGAWAFGGCGNLSKIEMPDSVARIGSYALYSTAFFDDETNWTDEALYCGHHLICTKTSLSGNYAVLPETICIADEAFRFCERITEVTFPDSVRHIGSLALQNCAGLKSVTIPDNVTSIGENAFQECTELDHVTLGRSVSVVEAAFNVCPKLTVITVDEHNENFIIDENGALYNKAKTALIAYPSGNPSQSFVIPDGVTTICKWAVSGQNLVSVTIPESVSTIRDYAFAGSKNLLQIEIPNRVTRIGEYVFASCTKLSNVMIGNSVKEIGYKAFAECRSLVQVHIPPSTTSIDSYAFFISSSSWYICSKTTDCYAKKYAEQNNIEFRVCDGHGSSCAHDYTSEVTTEPTCAAAGVRTYTCTICGDSYTEDIEKIAHTPEDVTEPATCTAKGRQYTKCSICGETLSEAVEIPALGHAYDSAVTTEPTCTAEGVTTYTCARCGDSYTEPIQKTDHTEKQVRIEPTCTAVGSVYTVCAVCGEPLSEAQELPPLGHAYNAVVTKEPTCSAEGVRTFTCTRCGDSYTESIDKTAHTPQDVTEPATCTADGKQYTKCSVCGETLGEITVLPMIAHSFGAWVTVKEATTEAEGLQERACIYGCGTKETQVLPKIPTKTVKDTGSGISLTYPETAFEDDAELQVEQIFDGAAFNLVDLNSDKNAVFDITMVKDGAAVQPNGKVTVRIPVPSGFDPAKCMVYHVNTETGKLEKMNARYENGFMVFETDHFSYYAIVIEKPIPPTVAIRNYTQSKTVDYRTTITFTAEVTNPVSGAAVHWYINGQDKGAADTYTEKEAKATYTVQTKYIKDGKVLAESETETVNVKTGFFAKLKAFFRALFGRLPKQVQEAYDLDLLLKLLP